jgi:glutamate mutase epsilon subunit
MYTPGPATSFATWVFGFPQNEHRAMNTFSAAVSVMIGRSSSVCA